MDEQRLGQVFRDAVEAVPPASFGRDEVVAASRRATARRRGMLAGGTLLSLAVLAGVVVAGDLVTGLPGDTAGNATVASGGQAESGALSARDAPRCGPIDAELVTGMTALLANRSLAVSGPAGAVPEPCPAGSRSAAVPVPGGVLYVLLVPQAEPERVGAATAPDAARQDAAAPDGARSYAVTLDGGRTLVVISKPGTSGQPAPLASAVPELARELAAGL